MFISWCFHHHIAHAVYYPIPNDSTHYVSVPQHAFISFHYFCHFCPLLIELQDVPNHWNGVIVNVLLLCCFINVRLIMRVISIPKDDDEFILWLEPNL